MNENSQELNIPKVTLSIDEYEKARLALNDPDTKINPIFIGRAKAMAKSCRIELSEDTVKLFAILHGDLGINMLDIPLMEEILRIQRDE